MICRTMLSAWSDLVQFIGLVSLNVVTCVRSSSLYQYLFTYIYLFFSCSITHSLSLLHSHLHGGNVFNFDFVPFIDIKIEIETFLTVLQYTLAPLSLFPISVSLAHSLCCIHYSFSLSRCRSVFFYFTISLSPSHHTVLLFVALRKISIFSLCFSCINCISNTNMGAAATPHMPICHTWSQRYCIPLCPLPSLSASSCRPSNGFGVSR